MRLSMWLLAFAIVFTYSDPPYSSARGLLLLAVYGLGFVLAVWGDVRELGWGSWGRRDDES